MAGSREAAYTVSIDGFPQEQTTFFGMRHLVTINNIYESRRHLMGTDDIESDQTTISESRRYLLGAGDI